MKRPSTTTDEYGNQIPGDLVTVKTLQALVAPQVADEPKLLGRSPIDTNYNIYLFGVTDSGVLPDDVLEVRGENTPVDGRIATWKQPPGGDHIQVRLVNG